MAEVDPQRFAELVIEKLDAYLAEKQKFHKIQNLDLQEVGDLVSSYRCYSHCRGVVVVKTIIIIIIHIYIAHYHIVL